jgi:hypothetical protein
MYRNIRRGTLILFYIVLEYVLNFSDFHKNSSSYKSCYIIQNLEFIKICCIETFVDTVNRYQI